MVLRDHCDMDTDREPKKSATPHRGRGDSALRDWLRALEATAPIEAQSAARPAVRDRRTGASVRRGRGPDLRAREFHLSRARRARQPLCALGAGSGLAKGDTVCLLMPNRPEYMAIWLGITGVGGVVALHQHAICAAPRSRHCIDIVAPRHIIVAAELLDAFRRRVGQLAGSPAIWSHGGGADIARIDREVERFRPRG